MANTTQRGMEGENRATDFFVSLGYEVVARNYRYLKSEIDLIVRKNNLLVFVEVKLRTSVKFGFPEQSVNPRKRTKILEGAAHYLEATQWQGQVRYDIVAIHGSAITHFEDAFY